MVETKHQQFVKWLEESKANVAITITLKQGLPLGNGRFEPLTDHKAIQTARLISERITKGLVGTRGYQKRGERLPFLVFLEGDRFTRKHFHIAAVRPPETSFSEYEAFARSKIEKLNWVYNQHVSKEITGIRGWIKYDLKNGIDAFIPEASILPIIP